MADVNEILNFWFGQTGEAEYGKSRKVWFVKDSKFDTEVQERFQADYELAATGRLKDWEGSAPGCLALILLLDQFSRNMFRGTPKAFAADPQALSLAKHAIAQGFDQELLPVQRWFVYLPFEHSENLADQHQAVSLFRQISNELDSTDALEYAIKHLQVIERFGRFPHRNRILGRVSTPEEEDFLSQPGSSF